MRIKDVQFVEESNHSYKLSLIALKLLRDCKVKEVISKGNAGKADKLKAFWWS